MRNVSICILALFFSSSCSKRVNSMFNKDGVVRKSTSPYVSKCVHKICPYTIDYVGNREIKIRYLGCGGFYIGNEEEAILIDPFFSNRSLLLLSPLIWVKSKPKNIEEGLDGILEDVKEKVKGVYVTHAHYDHLLDVPYVYEHYLKSTGKAKIYTSTSGENLLSRITTVKDAVVNLEEQPASSWYQIGATYPQKTSSIKVTPILTSHAPHFRKIRFFDGEAEERRRFTKAKEATCTNHWKLGQTYAFMVDFNDENGNSTFRIFVQSSAAQPKFGQVPQEMLEEKGIDLAIIGAASYAYTNDYPEGIVDHLNPKKIIICHWEDFFVRYKRRKKRLVRGTDVKGFINRLNAVFPYTTDEEKERFTMPDPGVDITIKY